MDVGTKIFTWMNGKLVGEDAYGNKYYVHRRGVLRDGHEMRWCMYKGLAEASKVPPEWHHWLHHGTDAVPTGEDPRQYAWQKEHQPNLTGTPMPTVRRVTSWKAASATRRRVTTNPGRRR